MLHLASPSLYLRPRLRLNRSLLLQYPPQLPRWKPAAIEVFSRPWLSDPLLPASALSSPGCVPPNLQLRLSARLSSASPFPRAHDGLRPDGDGRGYRPVRQDYRGNSPSSDVGPVIPSSRSPPGRCPACRFRAAERRPRLCQLPPPDHPRRGAHHGH